MKGYIKRLSEYQYLIQHPSFKQFIEKKMEIKKHVGGGSGSTASETQIHALGANPFEVADRFREIFTYLMEVPIQDADYEVIGKFDKFIKADLVDLDMLRSELKQLHLKVQPELKMEGKIYQKITYQSLYYQLKMTAEALGIKNNRDLMNLSSNSLHQRVNQLALMYPPLGN